jgi:hypothetical protein
LIISISSTIVVPSIVAKSIVNKKIVTKTTTGVSKDNSLLKQLGPVLCSSFFATAMIYPLDIVRSLTMGFPPSRLPPILMVLPD